MTTAEAAEAYYGGGGLAFPYLVADSSSTGPMVRETMGPVFIHQEILAIPEVDKAMDEVARSIRLIRAGDSRFEIATANNEAPSQDVMLHISTYSSAISTNYGNGYEFAAQAVRYPDYKHLYVASFGNGSTSPLLPEDAAYVRRTGRFTREVNGEAVPLKSLQNLHYALSKEGLSITKLMGTDSAGGHYARALALAMERGQLTHAFFSETSGFVNLSIGRIASAMLIKENVLHAKQNRGISPDPEKIDRAKVDRFAKAFRRYAELPNRDELAKAQVTAQQKAQSMVTSLMALRRGPSRSQNPLADDTNALIGQQPQAQLTYGTAEHDPLYKTPEELRKVAELFLGSLAVARTPVRVALIPGMTHTYNTFFPSLYHAVKRDALELT